MKNIDLPGKIQFSEAFKDELEYFCQSIELPPGIAKTQALKENLFATIVCTVTHTPLVIVGAPGSSKTLSFNLAIDNLKGPESKRALFRKTEIFTSLDPHFYQCSRQTTSNEIQTVFSHAINRQKKPFNILFNQYYCVVFMVPSCLTIGTIGEAHLLNLTGSRTPLSSNLSSSLSSFSFSTNGTDLALQNCGLASGFTVI